MSNFLYNNTNHYPFGALMPGRYQSSADYRYGFNGMEHDDEVKSDLNAYEFGGRSIYDGRIGRFVSVDPRWRDFTSMSPYAFAANTPIQAVDVDGEGPEYALLLMHAKAVFGTASIATSGTIQLGTVISAAQGMAVDKNGNVALFVTFGGLASDVNGPSISGIAAANVGFSVNSMPGINDVRDLKGAGGVLSASGGTPFAQIQGDFISDGHDNIIGFGLTGTLGPDASVVSYQNTTTNLIAMTSSDFQKMESVGFSAWSNADKLAKDWTKASTANGAVGIWEAGKSVMSYEAVTGQEGVYQAVVNTTMMYKPAGKGENNATVTNSRVETGVYFKQDGDGNLISTDFKSDEQ